MRLLIQDFKEQVRVSTLPIAQLMKRCYFLTMVYGLTDLSAIRGDNVWPEEADLKKISAVNLKNLKVRSIKYYKVGSILSMQFVLNDGTVSPFAGESGVDRCNMTCVLPEDRPVKQIKVKASKNWVNEIKFMDETGSMIGEVKADSGVGDWYTIDLVKGERIIGFQESHDGEKYVRRFGFVTIKPLNANSNE